MRVVLDSNVIIAAFATEGMCHSLFEACLINHTLILSEDLLREIRDHLEDKIKLPSSRSMEIISFLKKHSALQTPPQLSPALCRDPDDVKVLALALGSKADCMVTGDKDLLVMKSFQGIPILSPREFWEELKKHP